MTDVPPALRRQFTVTALVAGVVTVGFAAAVASAFTLAVAVRWVAVAVVPVAYTLWLLQDSLDANHPPESTSTAEDSTPITHRASSTGGVYESLGVANGVTLARGWLYAWVAGCALVPPAVVAGSGPASAAWAWLPAVGYGFGAGLDYVDGAVAGTVGRRTRLGERMDLAFDTMGFLVAPIVAVAWGALPIWYLSISAARYLFRFGCWVRDRRGRPVGDLPDSRVRRPLAGLQMAVIAFALLPVTPRAVVWPVATAAMAPTLLVFARDYLAVTGRFGKANPNETPVPESET
jgi:CDP-diacylglycerol--glycerol-3-phosphate 3-phosphatidyltransferase